MANKQFLFGTAALLGLFSLGDAQAGYFKCVDSQGHVTYATTRDSCPSQQATEIEKGREVKKKPQQGPADSRQPGPEDTPEQIEQKRHDQALLGTYANEEEIDQALKRNLQTVDARINSIQLQMKTVQDDLDKLAQEKADKVKAGKPIEKSLKDEIDMANAKMAKLQNELAKAKADSESIKAHFAADKQRYRELTKKP